MPSGKPGSQRSLILHENVNLEGPSIQMAKLGQQTHKAVIITRSASPGEIIDTQFKSAVMGKGEPSGLTDMKQAG